MNTSEKTTPKAKASNSKVKTSSKISQSEKVKNHDEDSDLLEFFVDELKDIYWAENHLLKALPEMKEAATTAELEDAIAQHIVETENQVARLDQIFEILGEKAEAKKCEAMAGLVKEAQQLLKDTEDDSIVRDVAIIFASQKVEHYEIATYGSLKALAQIMGESEIEALLEETLAEEKNCDVTLSTLATGFINEQALKE